MGNTKPASSASSSSITTLQKPSKHSKIKNILDDYIPKKKITDQRYGEAILLQHKLTKDFVVLKELTTNDSRENFATSIKWGNRLEMQHPNIVQILGFVHFKQTFKIYFS